MGVLSIKNISKYRIVASGLEFCFIFFSLEFRNKKKIKLLNFREIRREEEKKTTTTTTKFSELFAVGFWMFRVPFNFFYLCARIKYIFKYARKLNHLYIYIILILCLHAYIYKYIYIFFPPYYSITCITSIIYYNWIELKERTNIS